MSPNQTAQPAPGPVTPPQVEEGLALRYARAVQEGNCDFIIPHTAWMRERLKIALSANSGAAEADQIRAQLCDKIQSRPTEGNQLRKEGVEDQYVFAPGASLEWVRDDSGRTDLDEAVRRRTWIRVTFPVRSRALADLKGRILHSLVVGVNVSADDCVLKANVTGNLEIDFSSFRYDWPSP